MLRSVTMPEDSPSRTVFPTMPRDSQGVQPRPIQAENALRNVRIDGWVFTGGGPEVLRAIASHAGCDSGLVLSQVVRDLLVNKGVDWTSVILSEYLGLYEDSRGTFSLVWDDATGQLVSHGSVFQSAANPWAGLLAHIRTREGFKGLGLGTLVTDEVTAAAFNQGAEIVVLATDDKLNRFEQGERAAHSMYSRMGYTILGETRLADTIDWLMAVNQPLLDQCRTLRQQGAGGYGDQQPADVTDAKAKLTDAVRGKLAASAGGMIDPVSSGDLASLFVLLNLCPPEDFQLKLTSWHVHHGPELERTFITTLRQAIVDRDRLQDASMVLRDADGAATAVCAAQQTAPFTRQQFAIDFYCLPAMLHSSRDAVLDLVQRTIERIHNSPNRPRPCRLSFVGADAEKIRVFESLGFEATGPRTEYHVDHQPSPVEAQEYVRRLD